MRSMRRTGPLSVICVLALIYLLALLRPPIEVLESGSIKHYSWHMEYRVTIEPSLDGEDRPVLIMVTSAPENIKKRNAIRKSWGMWSSARVLYLVGKFANNTRMKQRNIEREAAAFGDIVQFDFVDSYRNLTLKTCALVMWAVRNSWSRRKLVIKVDDDTCVSTPLLGGILGEFKDGLYGEYREASKPIRCGTSGCTQWGLTLQEYEATTFPPHLQGSFYVIVEKALAKLHDFLFTPQFLFIEDVYLTGLVARAANVTVRPMPKQTIVNPLHAKSNWRSQKDLLAQHRCNENFQQRFWYFSSRRTT